jgi:hypothetical protein
MNNFVISENVNENTNPNPTANATSSANKRLRGLSEISFDPHDGICISPENTVIQNNVVVSIISEEATYKKNGVLLDNKKKDELRKILDNYINSNYYFKYYLKTRKISVSKSCTISQLKELIIKWYILNINTEKIQAVFRGSLIRKWILLRGPGLISRKLCVNETDFCTLEPLVEIENKDFFSYTEPNGGCIFGFDIRSLWSMYKKKGIIIINPTTKNLSIEKTKKHNNTIIKEIEEKKRHNDHILNNHNFKNPYTRGEINGKSMIYKNAIDLYFIINLLNNKDVNNSIISNEFIAANYTFIYFPLGNINNFTNQQIIRLSLQRKINEIRNKPLITRINEAFLEIGYLDFYTNANWFFNMNRHQCYIFLQRLKNIWDYGFRNNFNRLERILDETKNRICFLHDPFLNINCNIDESEISMIDIQTQTIYVIENFIYLGIDVDNRKLGAMYVLAALTTVSNEARSSLNWLYENFNF